MRTAGNPIFINRVVLFFKTSPGIQWDISFIKVFMISERITGKKFGIECRSNGHIGFCGINSLTDWFGDINKFIKNKLQII